MEALTDAVVARLQAEMDGYTVDRFPDVPARYPWAGADKLLLVAYERSNYGDAASLEPFYQDRTYELSVTVVVRSLRGPEGAGDTIDAVADALMGWSPPTGGTPLLLLRDEFVSEDQGTWRFVVAFQGVVPKVAAAADRTGPLLTEVTVTGSP
jgi:Gp37 protein